MSGTRMQVEVGRGLVLRNPVLTASGTFGYGLEFAPFVDLAALGGIVVKGISPRPRAGNPPSRIVETPCGMLNAIGLQNVGVERFRAEKLPLLREHGATVVVNVYGHEVADYVAVVRALEPETGIAAFELNLSCPNVRQGGLEIGRSPDAIREVTAAVRQETDRPLWVKLTPAVTDIAATARAAVDGGADAVSLVNTFPGMVVDVETRRPVLHRGTGGLSGPAIRPLAVALVHRVAREVDVPVIGIGGITSVRDVVEFLLVGAPGVELADQARGQGRVVEVRGADLDGGGADRGVADVRELIGALEENE